MTFFFGVYDPATGSLKYVNAGHNPPLHLWRGGTTPPASTGVPIGLFPMPAWKEAAAILAPGDTLVLYTDGLTEATSPADEELGDARFRELAASLASRPTEEVVFGLLDGVAACEAGSSPSDDKTLVVMRRRA